MRQLPSVLGGILMLALIGPVQAQNTNNILGQWDFNSTDLTAATVGSPLQLLGDIQGTFLTNQIAGDAAGVMRFPAATREQGFLATFPHTASGGGTNLNAYTILMDVMWPEENSFSWRGLFNASTNNENDVEILVNPDNQLGLFNDWAFEIEPGVWHRIALVYNLTNNTLTRFLNGDMAPGDPVQLVEGGVDSRYSLRGGVLFFTDNNDETMPGFVNSLQIRSGAMVSADIVALRGPSAGGLNEAGNPPVVGDIRITGIVRSGNNVVITLSDARNAELQRAATLNNASWQSAGVSNTGTFTVPITDPTSFFRVVLR